MAYQKELWTTMENIREEIEDLLDDIDFLEDGELKDWPSESEYLQYKIIPELIDQMVDDPANEGLVQKLDSVRDLVTSDEIGVAISDKDIPGGIGVYPLKIDQELTSLMILATPNVLHGLESGDDRTILKIRFRYVFLQAADRQRELALMKKYVPYSKV